MGKFGNLWFRLRSLCVCWAAWPKCGSYLTLCWCVWVWLCALFLKSSDNVPCIIYISMHITRLKMRLQNHARVVGALCCFLCGFILCSICYVVFLVLVLYFFVLNTKRGSASQLRCNHLWLKRSKPSLGITGPWTRSSTIRFCNERNAQAPSQCDCNEASPATCLRRN